MQELRNFLSTQIPGFRNKKFLELPLLIDQHRFEISIIQDSGDLMSKHDTTSEKFIGEDFVSVASNGVITVGDGVSPVHNAAEGIPYFGVYPYGLLPGLILENVASKASQNESATNVLHQANCTLDALYKGLELTPYTPHNRGGATFVVAKFYAEIIELIGGGDTYAFWELKNGSYGWFLNQVQTVDELRIEEFNRQLIRAEAEHGYDAKSLFWSDDYYGSYFKRSRDQYTNNPNEPFSYALLDGAPFERLEPLLQRVTIPTETLQWLVIATDGCFSVEFSQDMEALWHTVHSPAVGEQSLKDFLDSSRQAFKKTSATHTQAPEMVFVLIRNSK